MHTVRGARRIRVTARGQQTDWALGCGYYYSGAGEWSISFGRNGAPGHRATRVGGVSALPEEPQKTLRCAPRPQADAISTELWASDDAAGILTHRSDRRDQSGAASAVLAKTAPRSPGGRLRVATTRGRRTMT